MPTSMQEPVSVEPVSVEPASGYGGWLNGDGVTSSAVNWKVELPTSDPIEVRIMLDQSDENVGISHMELYVR